jgi:hypothetical protein
MNQWTLRFAVTLLAVLTLILGTASAASALGATSTQLSLHFIRSGDCTAEDIEISGTIHVLNETQADGSLIGHFNYQNVSGVGLTSGNRYRVSALDHIRLAAPFPADITSISSFRLIGLGSDSNLLVHVMYHITVNANGEVTISIDDLTMQCTP